MSRRPSLPGYDPGKDEQLRFISDKEQCTAKRDNFARVYNSLYYNKAFIELSRNAQMLYIGLMLECRRQGNRACVYPKSLYSIHFAERQFKKARDELENAGFIEMLQNRTKPTIYTLSDKWKAGSGSLQPAIYTVKISKKK